MRKLIYSILAVVGIFYFSFLAYAEINPGQLSSPPAKVKIKMPEHYTEYTTVKAAAIHQLVASDSVDFPYTKEMLCQKAYDLIKKDIEKNSIQLFGCNDSVPEELQNNTIFFDIEAGVTTSVLYKGKLSWKRADIKVNTFRLNPRHSIPPYMEAETTVPLNTEQEKQLFKDNFDEMFANQIHSVSTKLRSGE